MDPFLKMALIIAGCLLIEGFFSGSEIALVAANRKRHSAMADSPSRTERLTWRILQEPSWFLSTTLVGSNLAEITHVSLITAMLMGMVGSRGDLLAFLILTPLILFFGEILPKSLFQGKADRWVGKIAPAVWVFSILLFPLVWSMSKCTQAISRFLKAELGDSPFVTREELQLLLRIEGGRSDLKPMEKEMIRRILRLSTMKMREVMIPLVDVVSLEENSTVQEAMAVIRQENYSRYPVYRERVDNIIGIIHSFDLLFVEEGQTTIQALVRPVSFFPETKAVDELLLALQRRQETLAVVVDEYGGAVGIVTIEDILEEVVGEIQDEYDREKPLYQRVGPNQYRVSGRMEIDHLNEILKLNLPKGDYETLGGFILDRLGRVPLPGESVRWKGALLEVQRASEKSVIEVLLTLKA
jgi:putative hemolysin